MHRKATSGDDLGSNWEPKETLVQDAVGPVYAERGGLYGVLHDTYGKSTYDRIRVMIGHEHAVTRLNLAQTRSKRLPVGGISYDKGYPEPLDVIVVQEEDEDDDEPHANGNGFHSPLDSDQDESGSEAPPKKSKKERSRSKTPQGKKKSQ